MTDSPDGPPLLRPIPRRPFNLNLDQPTPPEEAGFPPTPNRHGSALNLDKLNSRLLDPRVNNAASSTEPDSSLSRAQSVLNLTGSTLMGIYSPTTYGKDRFSAVADDEQATTPWGTGALTPARDDPNYDLQCLRRRRRSTQQQQELLRRRRRSSAATVASTSGGVASLLSQPASLFYLGLRALLLASLGALYGLLVAQVHDRSRTAASAFRMETLVAAASDTSINWRYMAFWALAGVGLGSLLPWFDGVWEGRAPDLADEEGEEEELIEELLNRQKNGEDEKPATDWALAIRGIGTFVGIAFAIRKLPWDSTLQVSCTLALVNPVLWFLIDRSMPGFLVSAGVGLAGSAVLMGVQPDMVPIPSTVASSASSSAGVTFYADGQRQNGSMLENGGVNSHNTGLNSSQETVASAIWMLSVLFCCCVCFGNIGRWLALNRAASTKGRWAERR
ncbi:insulin-induced protein [Xylariomycetidae sp. FL0641]|nr:insulin-induced protein [Xylariomycetidae sp. FL0641]